MIRNEALLRAIFDNPDDDAPRLVYADWLEEHGDAERAEFIRVQIELERLPWYAPERRALRRRGDERLQAHRKAWLQELPGWARHHVAFRRGFAHFVRCTANNFRARGARLFAQAPVRHLWLTQLSSFVEEIARLPLLERVTTWEMRADRRLEPWYLDTASLTTLARSPYLGRVTTLILAGQTVEPAGLEQLGQSASLRRVTRLHLTGDNLSEEAMRVLVAAPTFARLSHLDLTGSRLGQSGVPTLLGWAGLAGLCSLRCQGLLAGSDDDHHRLADCPYLKGLKYLDLRGNSLRDEAVRRLARSAALAGLEGLDLRGNPDVTPAGWSALAGSPTLTQLRWLGVNFRDGGADARRSRAALETRFGPEALDASEEEVWPAAP